MTNQAGSDAGQSRDVVSAENVESLIETKAPGKRLKQLRLKRSMGLVELGLRSGLSASFLSQIETGRVVPTVRNLMRLSMVFNVDISYFFKDSEVNRFQTLKAKDRVILAFGAKQQDPYMFSESMAALVPDRRIVPCIAELRPGNELAAFDAHPFNGLEFAFVMDGSISLSTKKRSELLEEHDVVWIDGNAERRYQCVGDVAAKVMIISFPFQA